jgi:hypothetical protein
MHTPDALDFALLASYWENRVAIGVVLRHLLLMFEVWAAAKIDRECGGGSDGGLTMGAKFA